MAIYLSKLHHWFLNKEIKQQISGCHTQVKETWALFVCLIHISLKTCDLTRLPIKTTSQFSIITVQFGALWGRVVWPAAMRCLWCLSRYKKKLFKYCCFQSLIQLCAFCPCTMCCPVVLYDLSSVQRPVWFWISTSSHHCQRGESAA